MNKYILQQYNDQYGRWDDHFTFYELERLDDILKSHRANEWRGYRVVQIVVQK